MGAESANMIHARFKKDCYNLSNTNCIDIRICKSAAASIAMGGWPVMCGLGDDGVPKVCCGYPLVLGRELMRKVKEEKRRYSYCGRPLWAHRLSQTEYDFYKLLKGLLAVNASEPSPMLSRTEHYFDKMYNVQSFSKVNTSDPTLGKLSRIIDNYQARISFVDKAPVLGEFPWMVSVSYRGTDQCGGSLIDRIHVLTAAHCVINSSTRRKMNVSKIAVHAGDIINLGSYRINVVKILIHEQFNIRNYSNDIAILTLEEEVYSHLRPICLPPPELSKEKFVGANTYVLGWGATSFQGIGTIELQVIPDIPVISNEECAKAYSKVNWGGEWVTEVGDEFLCAGLEEGGRDSCAGDSGGPLMYKYTDYDFPVGVPTERWVQVGIVSFGYKCGEPGYPGVYTSVTNYMDWILKNLINEHLKL